MAAATVPARSVCSACGVAPAVWAHPVAKLRSCGGAVCTAALRAQLRVLLERHPQPQPLADARLVAESYALPTETDAARGVTIAIPPRWRGLCADAAYAMLGTSDSKTSPQDAVFFSGSPVGSAGTGVVVAGVADGHGGGKRDRGRGTEGQEFASAAASVVCARVEDPTAAAALGGAASVDAFRAAVEEWVVGGQGQRVGDLHSAAYATVALGWVQRWTPAPAEAPPTKVKKTSKLTSKRTAEEAEEDRQLAATLRNSMWENLQRLARGLTPTSCALAAPDDDRVRTFVDACAGAGANVAVDAGAVVAFVVAAARFRAAVSLGDCLVAVVPSPSPPGELPAPHSAHWGHLTPEERGAFKHLFGDKQSAAWAATNSNNKHPYEEVPGRFYVFEDTNKPTRSVEVSRAVGDVAIKRMVPKMVELARRTAKKAAGSATLSDETEAALATLAGAFERPPTVTAFEGGAGDKVVLATDGVWEYVDADERGAADLDVAGARNAISDTVRGDGPAAAAAAAALVAASSGMGSKDDQSVVVVTLAG